jgi:hypothetical protein
MNESRNIVNENLYKLYDEGKVVRIEGVRPTWTLPSDKPFVRGDVPLVIMDLGNCHFLKELLPYIESKTVEARLYADLAYNGFGVSPPLPHYLNVYMFRATTSDRNSADVQLIWDLAVLLSSSPERRNVIIATKDLGFRSLKSICELLGHSLTFVTDWNTLRNYIE